MRACDVVRCLGLSSMAVTVTRTGFCLVSQSFGQEQLQDQGFEDSTVGGGFPFSEIWGERRAPGLPELLAPGVVPGGILIPDNPVAANAGT